MIFFWVSINYGVDPVFANNGNSVPITPISFGEKNGKVSFNNDDNSIRIERKVDGNTIRVQYNILFPAIRDIIRVNLAAGKFNSENSVIVNQLGTETISGKGVNVSDPVLLYDLVYTNDADIKTNSAKNDLYVSNTSTLSFKKGLIVLNKKFTDAFVNKNKSVFVAKVGFKVEDSDFPFMVANIAGTSGNLSNSYVTSFVLAESSIIIENKYVLTENNNLVKNAFNTSNNDINLVDTDNTVVAGSSLISYNDKYTESYAKTSNGSINVKKNVINISGTETGGAFFDATGGDVIIDTVATGDNGSIIIVIDGTKKIGGFVKTNRKVNIKTGTITVDAEILNNSTGLGMIDKSSSFIESNEIDATIGNLIIKKHEGYEGDNITLKKSFFKGYNESKIKLGRLELDGVSFDSNVFLMEANKVELTIENIKTAELEKVKDKLFIINENTESIILNLVIKGDGTDFNGFDYSGKPLKKATFAIDTSAGKFISNNVFLKSTTDNLDLTFNFTGVTTDKVTFFNNNSYLVDLTGASVAINNISSSLVEGILPRIKTTNGLTIKGINLSDAGTINFNFSQILSNNNDTVTIDGSLINSTAADVTTTLNFDFDKVTTDKVTFSNNNSYLVDLAGDAEVYITYIDEDLTNKLVKQIAKIDGDFTFGGFNFQNNGRIKNLNLSGFFDNISGSIVVANPLVDNNNYVTVNLGTLPNKKYTFHSDVIKTTNSGDITAIVNFENVTAGNFILLGENTFFINSADDVNLTIDGTIDVDLLNELVPKIVKAKGKFTFNGFKLSSSKDSTNNLDLTELFSSIVGNITVKNPLIETASNNLNLVISFANILKTIKFEDNVILLTKTTDNSDESTDVEEDNINISINFENIGDTDKFILTGDKFLISSARSIFLKIININGILLNELVPQIMEITGDLTFHGFDFIRKGSISNLDLSNLFNNVSGSIRLVDSLVRGYNDIAVDLGELPNKNYIFGNDIITTLSNGDITFTADFKNVSADKFSLANNKFLVNSAGNATLKISHIDEALLNKLAKQIVKTSGDNGDLILYSLDFSGNDKAVDLKLSGLFNNVSGVVNIYGSLIINDDNVTANLGVLPNKKYVFHDDIIKTETKGNIYLNVNLTNVSANNIILMGELINSVGNATLNLGVVTEELANKLALRKIKVGGDFVFFGFDFRDKGVVNNLYLSELFREVLGSVILTDSLVKNNKDVSVDLGELLDKEYTFRNDVIITEGKGNVTLAADFKNVNADKFNLADGKFLVNSAGNAILTLFNISGDLATKLSGQIVKAEGDFIFNGFHFNDVGIISNLNISGLFSSIRGSITIDGSLIENNGDINMSLGTLPNRKYLFKDDLIKTRGKGDIDLTINFTNITEVANFNLTDGNFLINSAGNATLVVFGMNEALVKKLSKHMAKATGDFTFNGFDFTGKGTINNLDISGIFDNIDGSITISGSLVKNVNNSIKKVNLGTLPEKMYTFNDDIIKTETEGDIDFTVNLKEIINASAFTLKEGKFLVNSAGNATINLGIVNKDFVDEFLVSRMVMAGGDLKFYGFNFSSTGVVKNLKLNDNLFKDVKGNNITLSGPLVTNNNDVEVYLKLMDKKYKFEDDVIKTENRGDIDLTVDFTNITDVKNFDLVNGKFLVNSSGSVNLTISGINEDLINKLVPQMVKTGSEEYNKFTFGGFDFSSNNRVINNLNLSGLLDNVRDNLAALTGSLVKNTDHTTVTLPYGRYLFNANNIALVETTGDNKIVMIDNSSSNLYINKLNVIDEKFINTALVLMTGNGAHKVDIKAKEFTLENSKIGAIVIDENIDSDGSGIKIISTEDLTISNNEFLQSFVVGPKQDIIIAGGVDRYTDIWGNFVQKGINTEKTVVIGNSLSFETIFGNFAKKDINMENYLITASKGIKFLGKKIIIDKSITSDFSGSSYGLFNADDGNIEIGDDNTETIAISGNETKQKYDANLMMANGDISFKSKESIDFALDKNTWEKALFANRGEVSFVSESINISGNNEVKTSSSNLIDFIDSRTLIVGGGAVTKNISIIDIALKTGSQYFFKISESIKINGKEDSKLLISNLKSNLLSDNIGAVFVAGDNGGNIQVKVGSLNIQVIDIPNSTIFKQNDKNSEDIIAVNNIIFDNTDTDGLYDGIGKSFKMYGYGENNYMNLNYYYSGNYGKAIIKFGNEEDNANEVQYNADAFTMDVGNFKLNPTYVFNTKAGIIFTNPRYIGTDNNGNIKETNGIGGDLKITIADGGILDLTMPNNLPSIAVVAKKQDYGDGTDKKVFEFGETIIEGIAGNKGATVKMSGYASLETDNFRNVSEYKNITAGDEVGKSKLTIGDNVREFDTGAPGSQYILHKFEMKGGMMIVRLNNKNKNVDLFKWAGDYKTLSSGAGKIGTSVDKGKIILTDKVKLDIEGDFLEGKFTLASPDNFEFVYDKNKNFKDLLDYDSDKTFETREVEYFDNIHGFVVTLGFRTGEDLLNSLIENGGLNALEAEILASSTEISRLATSNGGFHIVSGNSNFDNYSLKIYELAKNIFKKRQDKTKITSIINNVQMPDANENNSGMTGTIGLSSLKTVTDVLSDRIFENVASVNSADSGMMLFASANGGNGIAKRSDNYIGVFAKFNYGFGKLEASDGDRNIRNFGLLIGSDFGLLENKMILGASFMLDINSLEGSYRESRINSLIMSLYSKYGILESVNGDKLFIYGIVSYVKSSEKEDTSFKEDSINPENGMMYVINLANNKSNKSAGIIAVDVLGGYKFNNIGITPEIGIGFISGSQDSYQDNLGQNISSKDNIYLSLKTNVRYDIPMGNLSDIIAISLKLGISCDILSTGSNGFDVETPAGLKYHVDDVKDADRLSFSYSVNISYNINSSSKLSLSYNGTKTTNLLNNKFSFEYRYKIK